MVGLSLQAGLQHTKDSGQEELPWHQALVSFGASARNWVMLESWKDLGLTSSVTLSLPVTGKTSAVSKLVLGKTGTSGPMPPRPRHPSIFS